MPEIKPGNLDWLDDLAALTAQVEKTPTAKRKELAKTLDLHPSMITFLKAIKPCFDPAAIERVRTAEKANPTYTLSFTSAQALSGLNGKVSDLPGAIHAALDVILARQLATKDIKNLVPWIIEGNPAGSFDPSAKPPKTAVETAEPETVESEPEEESTQPNKPQKSKNETLGQQIGSRIDQFFGSEGSIHDSPKAKAVGGKSRSQKSKKGKSALVHLFKKLGEKFAKIAWKELFKIEHRSCRKLAHVIVPLHTSNSSRRHHKSGSFQQGFITLFLTVLHWVVYVLLQYGFLWTVAIVLVCPFVPWLKPFLEWPFRLAAHFAIYTFPAWVWANAQTHLGPTLIIGVLLAIGLYYAWIASPLRISLLGLGLAYLIFQGRGWATLPSPFSQTTASETQASASPQLQTSFANGLNKVPLAQSKHVSRPVDSTQTYQPSVSFAPPASPSQTLYDPKLLEQEIAALPQNCIVTAFPVSPDEGIPGDLAATRIQDMTDQDKYTLMIGGAKQKIENITAATTGLILNYKNTDVIDFLNTGGTANVIWEDMLYIHTDKIDIPGNNPSTSYYCTVIGSGAKNALTFRCKRADDLNHLVSALEYFIRNSRLGHDTALAGMPYPSQGLRFTGTENVINLLWANSPADMAGLKLGDHLWSIGKITSVPQGKNDLEAGLQTLPITLFVVSPAEWEKALTAARMPGQSLGFRPKLRKIILQL
jgi:hypothetical protein